MHSKENGLVLVVLWEKNALVPKGIQKLFTCLLPENELGEKIAKP